MKTKILIIVLFAITFVVFAFNKMWSGTEPWTEKQLMQPSELADILNNPATNQPIIYSIGPAGLISNSVEIGEGKDKNNLAKLKKEAGKLPKDANIVIYCGCCPFKDCPNIRPAFKLLNEMKFTNHKLLNLSHNLKVDWIDKGYPMNE